MPIIILNNNVAYIYDHNIKTLENLGPWNSQMNCAHVQDLRAKPSASFSSQDQASGSSRASSNIFNPENIKPGDTVVLLDNIEESGDAAPQMKVIFVSGKNKNKIYCREIGYELYATCFKKL